MTTADKNKSASNKRRLNPLYAGLLAAFPLVFMAAPVWADQTIEGGKTVTVSSGETLDTGVLTVGKSGTGTLAIAAGGVVTSTSATIGSGSSGTVSVIGSGSSWAITGGITVGDTGTGILTIGDGAAVTAGSVTLGPGGTLNLNGTEGSRGVLSTSGITGSNTSASGGTSSVVFDGGVLKATQSGALITGMTSGVSLSSGGGYIDTAGYTSSIAGTISGTGGLTKQGAGTLVLSGANTYTGDTVIEAGTLQLGDNTTTAQGSLNGGAGNIVLSGADTAVVFYNSINASRSGIISGSGSVTQKGSGTLTLTGVNTYTGTTTIASGSTLQIGGGGTAGSISDSSDVANSGTLIFNRSNAYTYGGTISGTGTVTQSGSGTTTLSGTNTYTGGTTISAGTLSATNGYALGTGAVSVASGSVLNLNFASNDDFSNTVSGAGSLSKTGAGTATVSGTNTYTGGTAVTAGTLSAANGSALGTGAVTVASGSVLDLNFSEDGTFSNAVSGAGSLTKSGTTTTVVSGKNTYTGGTTVSSGTLSATNASALGTGKVITASGSVLDLDFASAGTFANVLAGTGALTISGAGAVTLTGAGSKIGSISVNDGGLALSGTGSFTVTGDVSVADGEALTVGSASNLAAGGNVTVGSDALVTVSGNSSLSAGKDMTVGAGSTVTIGSGSSLAVTGNLALNDTSTLSVAAGSDTAPVTVGTATLAGTLDVGELDTSAITKSSQLDDKTYTVITSKANGGLSGDFSSVSTQTADYLVATGSLNSTKSAYNVGLSLAWFAGEEQGNGSFTITSGTFEVDDALTDQSGTFASDWDGKSLTKAGAGTLILSGNNSYTGTTTVNAGTLQAGSSTGFVQNGVWVVNGGTADLNNFDLTMSSLSGTGGTVALGTAALTVDQDTDTSFSGVISGTGSLTKEGSGTLKLSGVSTYTGATTVNEGTLALTGSGSLASSSGVSINSGTTFDITGTTSGTSVKNIADGTAGAGSINLGSKTLKVTAGSGTFSGAITGTGGSFTLTGGTLTLSGANTFTGNIDVYSGATLTLTGTSSDLATATVNGTLDISNINQSALNVTNLTGITAAAETAIGAKTLVVGTASGTYAGMLSSDAGGTFTVNGGSLTLTGNSSGFSGTANTNNTDLYISGTLGDATSTFNMYGGTLQGVNTTPSATTATPVAGTIGGNATINSGTMYVNNTTGSLTFGSDLTLKSGATVVFDFTTGSDTASLDAVSVGGNLTLGGTLTAEVPATGFYTLFTYGDVTSGSTVSGNFSTVTVTSNGTAVDGSEVITTVPNQVNLLATLEGQTAQFWDGTDATGDDKEVGGDGTWDSSTTNWAPMMGTTGTNLIWASSFGIFAGTVGTVTVSGTQSFDTLQFKTDGYEITGGALKFTPYSGSAATINADSGVTVTISSVLHEGTSQDGKDTEATALVKTGLGTLKLGGAGSDYTGGTQVDMGTLYVLKETAASKGAITLAADTALYFDYDADNSGNVINFISTSGTGTTATVYSTGTGTKTFTASTTQGNKTASGNSTVGKFYVEDGTTEFVTTAENYIDFNAYSTEIGRNSASGTLTLSGSNTHYTNVAATTLWGGAGAASTLNVLAGAILTDNGAANSLIYSNTVVKIDGNDSVYTVKQGLVLNGGSEVDIMNGGKLAMTNTASAAAVMVNNNGGATAKINVTGDNTASGGTRSTLSSGNMLYIARTGAAEISVKDGALLTSNLLHVGNRASGKLSVSGVNASSKQASEAQATTLVVGNAGDGTLTVDAGGIVTAATTTVAAGNVTGTINLSGTKDARGTLLTNSVTGGSGTGTLVFDGGLLKASAASATVGGLSGGVKINSGGAYIDSNGNTVTVSSAVTDGTTAGELHKQGDGKLILSGTNTYTGDTVVENGTLQIGAGGTTGTLGADSNVSLADGTGLIFNRTNTYLYDGVISGTGTVTQGGTGTTVLTGTNTYSGATTITAGALQVGNGGETGTLGNSPTVSVAANSTLAFQRSDGYTYDGVISGAGSLIQRGTGTTTLTNHNTYSGTTSVNAGKLVISDTGSLGTADTDENGDATGAYTYNGRITLGSGTTGGTFEFASSTDQTLSGTVSGVGSLVQSGSGTTTLSGSNTYSGGTTVDAGNLVLGNYDAAGTGIITVNADGTLTLNLATDSGSGDFANVLAGTGALIKTGTDTTAMTASESSIGSVTVSEGGLSFAGTSLNVAGDYTTASDASTILSAAGELAIGGTLTQASGSTLSIAVASNSIPSITAGSAVLGGELVLAGFDSSLVTKSSELATSPIKLIDTENGITGNFSSVDTTGAEAESDFLTFSTQVSGNDYVLSLGLRWNDQTGKANGIFTIGKHTDADNAEVANVFEVDTVLNNITNSAYRDSSWDGTTLTKKGDGTLILSATNTYTGTTTVNAGTLQVGNGGAEGTLGSNSNSIVADGANLVFNRNNGYTYSGTITSAGNVSNTGTGTGSVLTLAGVISGTGTLSQAGTGTTILTADNTYTGDTTVSAGILQVGNGGTAGTLGADSNVAVSEGAGVVFKRSNEYTYGGVISDAGTVTQSGSGTTSLTGSNTYTGDTAVSAGTLQIAGSGSLGSGSYAGEVSVSSGATFDYASTADQTLSGNAAVAGTLEQTGSGTLKLSGVLSGAGNLVQSGTGTTTLASSGSSIGEVEVSAGTLALSGTGTFTVSSGDYTMTGGTTKIDANSQLDITDGAYSQSNTSTLDVAVGTDDANDPAITADTATLAGTLNVSGYSATLSDTASGLEDTLYTVVKTTNGITGDFDNITIGGASSDVDYATVYGSVVDGTSYVVGFGLTWYAGLSEGNGVFTLKNSDNTFTVDVVLKNQDSLITADEDFTSGWNGKDLTKAGEGTLVLSKTNTYTGSTTVSAGTLQFGIADSIAKSSDISVASGATVDLNGYDQTLNNVSGAGSIALGKGTLTEVANADSEFSGIISGTGSVVKNGTGTWTLSGSNTYTGTTKVSAGTLQFGKADSIAKSSAVSVAADAVIDLNGYDQTLNNVSGAGSIVLGANKLTEVAAADSSTDFSGVISGTGAVVKEGTGTWTLSGSNTYTGATTVSAGTLRLTAADGDTVSASSNVEVGKDAVLDLADTDQAANNISGAGSITLGSGTLTEVANDNTEFSGVISGTGAVVKEGTGTWTLSGSNTYKGATTVSAGTLQISDSGTLGSGSYAGGIGVGKDATLNFASTANQTLSGAISGDGTLQQSGDSKLTLSGTGSEIGAVEVSVGTLALKGTGVFDVSGNYSATGATTSIDGNSQLVIGGVFTQDADSTLSVTLGNYEPVVTATSADITDSTLNINGFTGTLTTTASSLIQQKTRVLETTNGITGDFSKVTIGGAESGVDYAVVEGSLSSDKKSYDVGFGLTWYAGADQGAGTFTLTNSDDSFTVDVALTGQSTEGPFASGWDGESLTKAGEGTLILSATNTYTGSTTIEAGTLRLTTATGDAVSASSNVIVGSGADTTAVLDLYGTKQTANDVSGTGSITLGSGMLTEVANADTEFSGVVSGTGSVVKTGSGTWTLSGDNTYTGGTTVSTGTLQIGNGGTSGSVVGNITDNAAVVFNRSDAYTYAGVISGTGNMTQAGEGTLILTGDNTYTGGTTVSSGTLQLGDGGTTGSVTGNITDNGALVFNRSDDIVWDDVISGTGTVTKTGAGKLTVNSVNTYSGLTTLEEGTLIVGGTSADSSALISGDLTAMSGTTLGGHGTIGSGSSTVTIESGATLSPGNSIGTLTINGNLVIESGAYYEVEVDPADASNGDLTYVTGTATINGGSVLHIGQDGTYKTNTRYTILTAEGGVTGTFDDLVSNYAYLDPSLEYDANNAYLILKRNDVELCGGLGGTHNQVSTACGINEDSELGTVILNLDKDTALDAFNQLSGEVYASVQGAMIEDTRFPRDAVFMRMRSAFNGVGAEKTPVVAFGDGKQEIAAADTDKTAMWMHAFGSWSKTDSDGNAAEGRRRIGGFFVGADTPVADNVRAGVFGGYSNSSFDVNARRSGIDIDSYYLGAYAGGTAGNWRFSGGANYTWNKLDANRNIVFGSFRDHTSAEYDADWFQAFGEAAYKMQLSDVDVEPYAQLAYVHMKTDGFTEKGGISALTTQSQTMNTVFSTLGMRAAKTFNVKGTDVELSAGAGWRHAFGDVRPESRMIFADSGLRTFDIYGLPIARNAAVVEAGANMKLNRRTTLGVEYQGQFSGSTKDHGFKMNLNIKW